MKLRSKSDTETKEIGRRLGEKLRPGDIVCLYGELGAGKTTFVKGMAGVFGVEERDITSASFTIIAEHETGTPFYHIDLYRVGPEEIAGLGLHEYLGTSGVSVIEWAEKAEAEIGQDVIRVRIAYAGDEEREIEITGIEL